MNERILYEKNEESNREIQIDKKCLKFGKYAVIFDKKKFLNKVKDCFARENIALSGKLVDYYDEETFNGEIPIKNVIFSKQKRYSYQNEFRLAFNSNTTGTDSRTINIGSLEDFSLKTESENVNNLIKIEITSLS